ncbi:efflux RND transporter permease subunit [Paracraurococcus lichenis]|uniref:CusA/CzcA family heavy metal efflux RND transporter n=1 Tax=Paracraurococcus lichenis TaxID=3064888 RepID=A0ABT9E4X6_9PROT|nr:CusA/CzcA family heavy metal efflux RND transporter [Paracraurococcus sp. LOR1-02]MDO9711213.1 CusA/CzcA family heavy metal efflux RND transporter [Paracraurococcus sp. LOR1-02]
MIPRLIDAALANRAVVLILAAMLVAMGLYDLRRLPIDAQPDISPRQVLVITQAPGLGPLEVERFVTFPVELALQGLPHMENLRSVTRYGLSVVYVRFSDEMDIYAARNLVFSRLPAVQVPPEAGTPQMGPVSTGLGEIFQFEVRGQGRSLMELRTILDWQVAPRLRQVPGVIDVNANGGELKTYEVQVAADALTRYGLSLAEVFTAIERNNGARGGATLERNGEQAVIRGEGLIQDPEDIGRIVLRTGEGGVPLYVRDIARVTPAARPRLGAVTRDGRGEAVVGVALMLLGENTREVGDRVKAAIGEIGKGLPPGVAIAPYYDRADLITRTIHTVAKNLIEGAALVVVVLLVLLGNIRAGLVVALAIPLSMLAAATAMYWSGLSGNLMSLGAIDFGLIVDGAVVMIENVVRRRGEHPGRPVEQVVREAAHEVGRPILFAVTIITVVYLPLLSLQGVEGKMFRPMALTVMFALVASLVLTLVLMPVLATMALRGPVAEHDSRAIAWIRRRYAPLLDASEHHPVPLLGLALALLVGSGLLATRLGAEFIPRLDEGALAVTITKLPSMGLSTAIETTTLVERTLLAFPEVETVVSLSGSSEIPTDPMGVEQSDSFILLKPREQWQTAPDREGLIAAYAAALEREVPGMQLSWSQPIEMRMQDLLQGVRSDVAIIIYGDDPAALRQAAEATVQAVARVPGAEDVKAEQTAGQPYLRVIIDREAVARYGLNASDVLDVVEALGGRTVGTLVEGNARFDIRVRLRPEDRSDPDRIRDLRIADASGRAVPLTQLARVVTEDGPAQISREKGRRRITVEANVRGRDIASFVAEAQAAVQRQVRLPAGYAMDWGGQFQNLQEATARLTVVVPAALALIFALLFVMFRSLTLSALIFVNVPIAATGGVLALWLRGLPFSISAAVGFIALFGIAVLNGVVLVSTIVEQRLEGKPPMQAARDAAMQRLRPVLMTATVASLGFLPMAVSTSAGAEVQRPLATVVIGGLVTATLLTLLVLPTLYAWIAGRVDAPGRLSRDAAH